SRPPGRPSRLTTRSSAPRPSAPCWRPASAPPWAAAKVRRSAPASARWAAPPSAPARPSAAPSRRSSASTSPIPSACIPTATRCRALPPRRASLWRSLWRAARAYARHRRACGRTRPSKDRPEFRLTNSAIDRRKGCADALRKLRLRRAVGCLGGLVDERATAQLVQRQRRVHAPRVVEVAVDQPIEEMAEVPPPLAPGGVRVANDVDGAAVGQQLIELRPVGELVDPREI